VVIAIYKSQGRIIVLLKKKQFYRSLVHNSVYCSNRFLQFSYNWLGSNNLMNEEKSHKVRRSPTINHVRVVCVHHPHNVVGIILQGFKISRSETSDFAGDVFFRQSFLSECAYYTSFRRSFKYAPS